MACKGAGLNIGIPSSQVGLAGCPASDKGSDLPVAVAMLGWTAVLLTTVSAKDTCCFFLLRRFGVVSAVLSGMSDQPEPVLCFRLVGLMVLLVPEEAAAVNVKSADPVSEGWMVVELTCSSKLQVLL